MESTIFLKVDEQPLTMAQSLKYLQSSGKLGMFIGEILRQYVVEQELKQRKSASFTPSLVEQAIIDFRLEHQLTEPKRFEEWLARNHLDFTTFHHQIASRLQFDTLKALVIEDIGEQKQEAYFIAQKIFLDRVILSRIIVDNRELAEELYSQIVEGEGKFEELAREYSLNDERLTHGMMGAISRGTLPDTLRAEIDLAKAGDIIAPLDCEGRWGLFRVEEFIPASFEDERLRQKLRDEMFEKWLVEKIQNLKVQLQVA